MTPRQAAHRVGFASVVRRITPRISLRGSEMLSARDEVARGARLGRESDMEAASVT